MPRLLPRTPCALPALLPPCEFPFELMSPLLLLLFDELLFPFEVLPPFPRQPRPYTRPLCVRNSRALPCTTVLSSRPGLPEPYIISGDFAENLHGLVCGSSIGDIIKVYVGAAISRLLSKQPCPKETVVLVRKGLWKCMGIASWHYLVA